MRGTSAPESRALLGSHLLRAVLFGAAAGWVSSLLGGVVDGWVLYLGALGLAGAGGWVLVRPMERNSALAVLLLVLAAVVVYYLLRPPEDPGLLSFGAGFGGYVDLGGVSLGLLVGALLGRAFARP